MEISISTKFYKIIKLFRNMGFVVYSSAFMILMYQARMDYTKLIYFNHLGEGLVEYILALLWMWSIFVVYFIERYTKEE